MKDYIIADLDGTITIDDHRRPLIQSHGWDAYFKACVDDVPNEPVINFLQLMQHHYGIYILTGRSDCTETETKEWLFQQGVPYVDLLMRNSADFDSNATSSCSTVFRPDHEVKQEMLEHSGLTPENTLMVLDDRDVMLKFWRELGFDAWQVRPQGILY